MANITVKYIVYNRAGRRRQANAQELLIPVVNSTVSSGNSYAVPIFPTLEHNEQELPFAFLAASGTANGTILSSDPTTQNIDIGDNPVTVLVVYLPQGGGDGGPNVFVDAFNLDISDFTDSDFIEVFTGTAVDPAKTFEANEFGVVSSATAEKVRAMTPVDGLPFLEWKELPGSVSSSDRNYTITLNQGGFLFAFYQSQTTPPITIPDLDLKFGWIYVSPGVKVDGGGFVIGPRGPIPVGPLGGWFVRVVLSISRAFNKGREVSKSALAATADHLAQLSNSLRGK